MSDYPNERDCEHGHKRGKCVSCDLIESEARVRELEATLAARTGERDELKKSIAAMVPQCDFAAADWRTRLDRIKDGHYDCTIILWKQARDILETIAAAESDLAAARAEIAGMRTGDAHSCHAECPRRECVLRRERDRYKANHKSAIETATDYLAASKRYKSERDTLRAECDRLREFVPMTESRLRELLGPFYPDDAEDAEDVLRQANADPQEGKEWLPRYKAALSLLAMECGYLAGVIDKIRSVATDKSYRDKLQRRLNVASQYWQAHLRLVADEPSAALVARLGAE